MMLGATAIEDRLQDLVPEAIEDFLAANVKVFVPRVVFRTKIELILNQSNVLVLKKIKK